MRRADSASTIFAAAGCDADGGSVTGGTVHSELQRHSQLIKSQIIQQYDNGNTIKRTSEYHFPRRMLPTERKSETQRQCMKCSKHDAKEDRLYCQDCDISLSLSLSLPLSVCVRARMCVCVCMRAHTHMWKGVLMPAKPLLLR
jgi:hypothetical protein